MTSLELEIATTLHRIVGDDEILPMVGAFGERSSDWMNSYNEHLHSIPAVLMEDFVGQYEVLKYLQQIEGNV